MTLWLTILKDAELVNRICAKVPNYIEVSLLICHPKLTKFAHLFTPELGRNTSKVAQTKILA